MGLLYVLDFDLGLQVNASDSLGETDDSFQLSNGDRDACALLRDFLIFRVHAICHIHVLEDMACLL